ncbi:hypothetical protein D7V83_14205 [bacterium 0.1xD8-71]|nr:hypothetical protein D7V83_14205 [bacterium 0.1xD8-71]
MCFKEDLFDYQVLNLTDKFYSDYPDPPYEEILKKNSRPYNCLSVQSHYGYFICIPYRSHINHKQAFKFKKSIRSKRTNSGLDYSKIVIIKNSEYISTTEAIVDKDEFNETRDNIEYIKKDAQKYIDNYVDYLMGKTTKYDKREFERIIDILHCNIFIMN